MQKEGEAPVKFQDLTGKKFGRLTPLALDGKDPHGRVRWKCRCDCGREKTVSGYMLTSGRTLGCGCGKYTSGNTKFKDEQKITRDDLIRMRSILKSDESQGLAVAEVARRVKDEFPALKFSTLLHYMHDVSGATDKVFQMHLDGTLSLAQLHEIGSWDAVDGNKDFLADEVVEKKLNNAEVGRIKSFYKAGSSMSEAIKKATYQIPVVTPKESKPTKSIEELLDVMIKQGTMFRVNAEMAMKLLPESSLDQGKTHYLIFQKAFLLRHILKEQLEFVDQRVQKYIEEISEFLKSNPEPEVVSGPDDESKGGMPDEQADNGSGTEDVGSGSSDPEVPLEGGRGGVEDAGPSVPDRGGEVQG